MTMAKLTDPPGTATRRPAAARDRPDRRARHASTVLHDVDLELRAGELVALLGPNGAGKSTLLDALSGALAPAAGSVERHGRVAVALQSAEMARRSVLANLTVALGWWGVPRAQRAPRAREALEAIGAEHLAQRPATALSGGERRRVHLAGCWRSEPDVLLLDEPFAGLDPEVRAALLQDAERALRSARAGDARGRPRPRRGVGAGRPAAGPDRAAGSSPTGRRRRCCRRRRRRSSRGSSATTASCATATSCC